MSCATCRSSVTVLDMTRHAAHIRSAMLTIAVAIATVLALACGAQSTDTSGTQPSDGSETVWQAPLFKLPDANAPTGTEISLSQFRDTQPVVLVFYRAHW